MLMIAVQYAAFRNSDCADAGAVSESYVYVEF